MISIARVRVNIAIFVAPGNVLKSISSDAKMVTKRALVMFSAIFRVQTKTNSLLTSGFSWTFLCFFSNDSKFIGMLTLDNKSVALSANVVLDFLQQTAKAKSKISLSTISKIHAAYPKNSCVVDFIKNILADINKDRLVCIE